MPKRTFHANSGVNSVLRFPPENATVTERDGPQTFSRRFDECWNRLRHRFFRLERLQEYCEPGDPSYEAFCSGDFDRAERHLEDRFAAQTPLYEDISRKGLSVVRVRIVELPLSSYLKNYELRSYRIGARYGELVLVYAINEATPEAFVSSGDFILFDDRAVLVHDYGSEGLNGGWFIDRADFVRPYIELANHITKASVTLGIFERRNGL